MGAAGAVTEMRGVCGACARTLTDSAKVKDPTRPEEIGQLSVRFFMVSRLSASRLRLLWRES